MKKLFMILMLFLVTGCAFNANDWEPRDEGLIFAVKRCRTETIQRAPMLGPVWYLSKDFAPCMKDRGYYKK